MQLVPAVLAVGKDSLQVADWQTPTMQMGPLLAAELPSIESEATLLGPASKTEKQSEMCSCLRECHSWA